MASKKQIAEQAMRIISGGHLKPDRTIDIREVMLHLDQLRDAMVRYRTYENIKLGSYVVDEDFLSFYETVTVETDATKGLDYIDLPANMISLPHGLGLYQITPVDDLEDAFIIAVAGQPGLLAGTAALERANKTYCWTVNNVVYFKNLEATIPEVTVLMAASSEDILEDALFPVPPDAEAELLQQLLKTFGLEQQQPHDETEDGIKQ